MSKLYESYTETLTAELGVYATSWEAMTFTPTKAHSITSVCIFCRKELAGDNPGTVTVSIRATSVGKPTGADLTSGAFAGGDLTTTRAWKEVILPPYALTANTKYAIVIRAPDTVIGEPLLISMVRQSDSTYTMYAGGSRCSSSDSGSTWVVHDGTLGEADDDILFKEWGNGSGEWAGVIAIVETRFHYVDASGTERYIQGTAI